MKTKLILFSIIVIILLSFLGLGKLYLSEKAEKERLKVNQTVLAMQLQANEKIYSVKEFKEYQKVADSIAKANNIKTKQIIKYVRIHDSIFSIDTIILSPEIDMSNDVRSFQVETPCYTIDILSLSDTNIVGVHIDYDFDLFAYWQWNHSNIFSRLINFDFGKVYRAKCINRCSGDTLKIEENINVIKK